MRIHNKYSQVRRNQALRNKAIIIAIVAIGWMYTMNYIALTLIGK